MWPRRIAGGALAAWLSLVPAYAQAPSAGRLVVTVVDQTGGVLPTARVTVTLEERAAAQPLEVTASDVGVASFDVLADGRYSIKAEFDGFETVVVKNVRVRGAETRQRIVLPLAKVSESVSVSRDRQSTGLDPRGDAFSTILTRQQIDALPDDPDELEAVLKAMSPPGSQIRVDGFTGGRLPPKAQIRSIRLPRMDSFAAQNHGGLLGASFIDILTVPGLGPFTAGTDFTLRDDALSAKNPFVPKKGEEELHRFNANASGTIVPEKSSYSVSLGVTQQIDTENVLAALPGDVTLAAPIRRPVDSTSLYARFDQALTASHALRANFQRNSFERLNLGVGGYELPDRRYSTRSDQNTLRLSENGPLGQRFFSETRLQIAWQDQSSASAVEAPTIRVLDAFTSGGAQQRGGRHSTSFEFASDLDYVRGNHSWRTGVLLEGGQYRSDQFSNYLGTYTFSSLADYENGLPRTFTQRTGDPDIRYSNVQFGAYAQDDWRASRSILVSAGVRYEAQTHMPLGLQLSPRGSAAWSPFRAGHTTLRVSGGYFYDWLDMSTYEQSLRLDGVRQREIQVLNPEWPDPGAVDTFVRPGNSYFLDPNRQMAASLGIAAGIDRKLGRFGTIAASYTWRDNLELLSGRNRNAPVDDIRPDPRFANIVEAESVGASRSHSINLGWNAFFLNWHRTTVSTNYSWTNAESNTIGAFGLPAHADLAQEWGPTAARHRFGASFGTQLVRDLALSLNMSGQSGAPYNVTTGIDLDGDGVFNDRPTGVGRNSATGAVHWTVNGRLTYSMGFGKAAPAGGGGGPTIMSLGGGGGSIGGFGAGGNSRVRVDFYVAAQNLFNRDNYVAYSGVMTSPFFGEPTNVMNPRKIEIGIRIGI